MLKDKGEGRARCLWVFEWLGRYACVYLETVCARGCPAPNRASASDSIKYWSGVIVQPEARAPRKGKRISGSCVNIISVYITPSDIYHRSRSASALFAEPSFSLLRMFSGGSKEHRVVYPSSHLFLVLIFPWVPVLTMYRDVQNVSVKMHSSTILTSSGGLGR